MSYQLISDISFFLRDILTWYNIYLIGKYYLPKEVDLCSIIHSTFTGLGVFFNIYPINNSTLPNIALTYSVYDIVSSLKIKRYDFLFHGLIYFISFLFININQHYIIGNIFLFMNVSSVFMNIDKIFKGYRLNKNPNYKFLYFVNKLLFALSFLYFRFYLVPTLTYSYIDLRKEKDFFYYFTLTGTFLISMLNLYWLYYIFKNFIKLING